MVKICQHIQVVSSIPDPQNFGTDPDPDHARLNLIKKSPNKGFSYYFMLMMERSGSESGSLPLSNGSRTLVVRRLGVLCLLERSNQRITKLMSNLFCSSGWPEASVQEVLRPLPPGAEAAAQEIPRGRGRSGSGPGLSLEAARDQC